MGFKSVYQMLADVFPQVDARILKAVAIENSKNAEAAVEIVLSEILPYLSQRSMIVDANSVKENSTVVPSDGEAEQRESGLVRCRGSDSSKASITIAEAIPTVKEDVCGSDVGTCAYNAGKENIPDKTAVLSVDTNVDRSQFTGGVESSEVIPLEKPQCQFGKSESGTSETKNIMTEASNSADVEREAAPLSLEFQDAKASFEHEVRDLKANFEHQRAQYDQTKSLMQDIDGIHPTVEQTAECAVTEYKYIDVSDDKTMEGNNYVVELPEDAGTFSPQGIANCGNEVYNHMDKIVILKEVIEEAKNNKKTLFLAMESIMNMMRKVELEEEQAELAKEEASRGGIHILKKAEDLKPVLEHAKEANNSHAGEVYGEKAILATEVRELQARLLSLSNERDNSLSVLDEMRQTLQERLTVAEELKRSVEQEKLEKEEAALKLLSEQESIMEKVVQESKILQQEADENSKLREFLMDRGQVVDTLQGEISVICQDVRLLKEKFDERIPLDQSISSSQTSCILASSVKSIASDHLLDETSKISKPASPASSVASLSGSIDGVSEKLMVDEGNTSSQVGFPSTKKHEGANVDNKELVEDGWELCE